MKIRYGVFAIGVGELDLPLKHPRNHNEMLRVESIVQAAVTQALIEHFKTLTSIKITSVVVTNVASIPETNTENDDTAPRS